MPVPKGNDRDRHPGSRDAAQRQADGAVASHGGDRPVAALGGGARDLESFLRTRGLEEVEGDAARREGATHPPAERLLLSRTASGAGVEEHEEALRVGIRVGA